MIRTYLDLSILQPLDVLLSSGDRLSSLVIRLATTLKKQRLARYSHAALLLSPSVTIEALASEGIVTRNLLDPSSRFGDPPASLPAVEGRWIDGQLHLFVELPGTTGAEVLRHVDLILRHGESLRPSPHDPIEARYAAIERLTNYYALQYSLLGRLQRAIVRLPDSLEEILSRTSQYLERNKSDPGPFCSELVCILMDSTFTLSGDGEGVRVAPSELTSTSEVLVPVANAVRRCSADELPGMPIDAEFLRELRKLLSYPETRSSTFSAKILAMLPSIEKITSFENPSIHSELIKNYFEEQRASLQVRLKEELAQELYFDADPVWRWIQGSNWCIGSCPESRNFYRKVYRLLPVSNKCSTMKSCSVGTTLLDLRENYERRFQQRLEESRQMASVSQIIRGADL